MKSTCVDFTTDCCTTNIRQGTRRHSGTDASGTPTKGVTRTTGESDGHIATPMLASWMIVLGKDLWHQGQDAPPTPGVA